MLTKNVSFVAFVATLLFISVASVSYGQQQRPRPYLLPWNAKLAHERQVQPHAPIIDYGQPVRLPPVVEPVDNQPGLVRSGVSRVLNSDELQAMIHNAVAAELPEVIHAAQSDGLGGVASVVKASWVDYIPHAAGVAIFALLTFFGIPKGLASLGAKGAQMVASGAVDRLSNKIDENTVETRAAREGVQAVRSKMNV